MAGPSKYNWEAIKEAYEGGIEKADIIKKYKVTNKLLLNKINQDKWAVKGNLNEILEKKVQDIIDDIGIEQFTLFVDEFSSSIRYLYILKMNRHRYYKIGIAENVEKRLATLQAGNPEKLSIIFKKEFAFCNKLEKALHKKYEANRMMGEWFSLTNEQKEELIKTINSIRIFNGEI